VPANSSFLFLRTEIRAYDFSSRVGIFDSNTVSVMHRGGAEKIRPYGIGAPETGRAFPFSRRRSIIPKEAVRIRLQVR
jgi:endonuclease YncB( thermonuclease family)